jgi:uncharacterized protein YkwD
MAVRRSPRMPGTSDGPATAGEGSHVARHSRSASRASSSDQRARRGHRKRRRRFGPIAVVALLLAVVLGAVGFRYGVGGSGSGGSTSAAGEGPSAAGPSGPAAPADVQAAGGGPGTGVQSALPVSATGPAGGGGPTTASATAVQSSSAPPSASPSTTTARPATSSAPTPRSPATSGVSTGTDAKSYEDQVLSLVNTERAKAGCGPVKDDTALRNLARAHSGDMADRGYFSHDTPEGKTPWDRAKAAGIGYLGAENIARGQKTPAAVMEAWMNSPGHRANILDCSLTKLGVGVRMGGEGPWWTQDFGR